MNQKRGKGRKTRIAKKALMGLSGVAGALIAANMANYLRKNPEIITKGIPLMGESLKMNITGEGRKRRKK